MDIIIELGKLEDVTQVALLYDEVVDDLLANINYPGWQKGIYPTIQDALTAIENKELYVARLNKQIIGCMTINHEYDDDYDLVNWGIDASKEEIYIIHTLATSPAYRNLKIARKLLAFVETLAKENKIKTIRLDVRKTNLPAIKLYQSLNYNYLGDADFSERGFDLGKFELYEKIIEH